MRYQQVFAAVVLSVALSAGSAFAQSIGHTPAQRATLAEAAPTALTPEALDARALDQVVLLLSGYEYFPSAGDLARAVGDPVPYLLVIAYDIEGRWLPSHHHRAIGALAYFPTPETEAHLLHLLEAAETPELMRHHVINALARGFGDEALEPLEPILQSDDLQLRLTAVSAIGTIRSPRSLSLLERRLSVEPHELVQERIQRSLSSQGAPGGATPR